MDWTSLIQKLSVVVVTTVAIVGAAVYAFKKARDSSQAAAISNLQTLTDAQGKIIKQLQDKGISNEAANKDCQDRVNEVTQFNLRFQARAEAWDRSEKRYRKKINFLERKVGLEETNWDEDDAQENPVS